MNTYIDLHMHSLYSDDGEYTPTQLVQMCHEQGIRIMAIADHDNAYANKEAKQAADALGMTYISGIEIDCTFNGLNFHVLGYGIDATHPDFTNLYDGIMAQEKQMSASKITLTNALGFQITKEQLDALSEDGVYSGELFAEVLLQDKAYKDHPLLAPYREGGARSDNPYVNFYWDYYAQGKPCYTEIVYPTLEETIALIKQHGGVAVLAHPGNNLKGQFEMVNDMIAAGIQGIEVFSSYHTSETTAYFFEVAKQNNLLITCGSDFHGKTKPSIALGASGCTIDQSEIEAQLKTYQLI